MSGALADVSITPLGSAQGIVSRAIAGIAVSRYTCGAEAGVGSLATTVDGVTLPGNTTINESLLSVSLDLAAHEHRNNETSASGAIRDSVASKDWEQNAAAQTTCRAGVASRERGRGRREAGRRMPSPAATSRPADGRRPV